jgi:aspartyl protease family protein
MNRLGLYLALIGAGCILLILRHEDANVFGVDSDDFADLVWYGVLALVLGAGLLADRARLGANLRHLLIWLVIVLVLVTAHVYRLELQEAASRVTAGLIPGVGHARRTDGGELRVTLTRSLDGHFLARGSVNGAPIEFLVDTGASQVVLTREDAIAAGIDVAGLVDSVTVSTANGRTRAAPVRLDNLEISGIRRARIRALVAREGVLGSSLLGMNFLDTLSGFEVRGDRLVLID